MVAVFAGNLDSQAAATAMCAHRTADGVGDLGQARLTGVDSGLVKSASARAALMTAVERFTMHASLPQIVVCRGGVRGTGCLRGRTCQEVLL
jgi:hypothetical protein